MVDMGTDTDTAEAMAITKRPRVATEAMNRVATAAPLCR